MSENLSQEDFEAKVIKAKEAVLVDFFATWCGPCQALVPTINELSKEAGDFGIYKVDVDESADLAAKYDIASVPTLIIFKGGQEVERLQGLQDKNSLLEALKKA